ncbi:MAG: RpiB/LacA/LacB family sugar-phosphate isomerase [Erysipelotrichaceae bacterium]|jgi:ribose 5-phosphate isomerase B|nr:RpiB/LacA/LacB family sugar-phosphate isomerase [Erysipelotrichaceae bacterium]MBR2809120.1 RpiB/LacA/LacB family sugar-phosphate isomerase [Erysipelotrichaceae bacterium]
MSKRLIIGADPSGFDLKEAVKAHLIEEGYEIEDVGTLAPDAPVDYYNVGYRVAKKVADKEYERGIVFCGTGMGVDIVANKFPGVYCGLVECVYTAAQCRIINNCNMLALGGFLNGNRKGIAMVDAFLNTDFSGSEYLSNAYKEVQAIEKKILEEYK